MYYCYINSVHLLKAGVLRSSLVKVPSVPLSRSRAASSRGLVLVVRRVDITVRPVPVASSR